MGAARCLGCRSLQAGSYGMKNRGRRRGL